MPGEVGVGQTQLVLGGRLDGRRSQELLEVVLLLQPLVETQRPGVEVLDDVLQGVLPPRRPTS